MAAEGTCFPMVLPVSRAMLPHCCPVIPRNRSLTHEGKHRRAKSAITTGAPRRMASSTGVMVSWTAYLRAMKDATASMIQRNAEPAPMAMAVLSSLSTPLPIRKAAVAAVMMVESFRMLRASQPALVATSLRSRVFMGAWGVALFGFSAGFQNGDAGFVSVDGFAVVGTGRLGFGGVLRGIANTLPDIIDHSDDKHGAGQDTAKNPPEAAQNRRQVAADGFGYECRKSVVAHGGSWFGLLR